MSPSLYNRRANPPSRPAATTKRPEDWPIWIAVAAEDDDLPELEDPEAEEVAAAPPNPVYTVPLAPTVAPAGVPVLLIDVVELLDVVFALCG